MVEGVGTRLVETLCFDCVIRLLWFYGDEDPRGNYVDVHLISNHDQLWQYRWRNRARNAWAVLRNRYDWSEFQFDTEEHARAFLAALTGAIEETWPRA
jgi:hypothetical protein